MNHIRDFKRLMVNERLPLNLLRHGGNFGYCPICQRRTLFFCQGSFRRDQYRCCRCKSIPRWRAIVYILETHFPNWRELTMHESSPGGASSDKFARECKHYIGTQYFPDVPPGQSKNGIRCEDLENLTFANESVDLVVTQDVFEHIPDAGRAFAEIARTLKPGGAHVFTVPWFYWKDTLLRAVRENGTMRHLEKPDYHGNPIDAKGSLVIREWGWDLIDFIYEHSRLATTAIRLCDRTRGLEGQFLEVFICRKPGGKVAGGDASACK